MNYRVVLQPRAEADLEQAYYWAARRAPNTAARWLARFEAAINTLASHPQRCSLAPETGIKEISIRQLLHGRRPHVWRVLFSIKGKEVRVLHVRRASMELASPEDLAE